MNVIIFHHPYLMRVALVLLSTVNSMFYTRGHGGRVVTLSPPTSEAGVWFPAWPQVGKLVFAGVGRQFTVHNLDKLYVLVSSALPTTHRDMTCTVLKAT